MMMMMMMRSTREERCSSDDDDDVLQVREGNSSCSSFIFEEKKLLFSFFAPRKQVNSLSLSLVKKHTHKQNHTQKKRARAHHSLDIQRRREVLSQTHAGKSLLSLRIQRRLQK